MTDTKYLFKLKTSESHTIKTLAELLYSCIKEAAFVIDQEGIRLTCQDNKTPHGTMCFDLKLPASNFLQFYLNPEHSSFVMGLNLQNFYKMLKTIKKKDILILEIEEAHPQHLNIVVQQSFENEANAMRSSIQILTVQPESPPECPYENRPTVCGSKEFARIRTFQKVDNTIHMKFGRSWVIFSIANGKVMTRSLQFGERSPDDQDVFSEQRFESETLTQLVKVAGISQMIQIYHEAGLPLKIQIAVGPLGSLSIFIKSLELLEREKKGDPAQQFDTQDYSADLQATI